MRCETCQAEMVLLKEIGDYVKLLCPKCNHIWEGTVTRMDMTAALRSLPRYRVVVVWADGRPSDRELIALRKLVPGWIHLTLGELRQRAGDSPEMALDHYVADGAADEIRKQASDSGLQVRLVPAPFEGVPDRRE